MNKLTACFSMAMLTAVMVACSTGLAGPQFDMPRANKVDRPATAATLVFLEARHG